MVYTFFGWDYINNEGTCHMSRDHYRALLDVCIKHSSFFSLRVFDRHSTIPSALEGWRVMDTSRFPNPVGDNVYYRMNKKTGTILLNLTRSVLCFSEVEDPSSPENFSCYRTDGTLLLNTDTHEAVCHLHPRSNEDISSVLAFGGWYSFDESGRLAMPAQLIKIRLPNECCITTDPFYLQLLEIKQSPHKHLLELTPKCLETWILNYWPPHLGEKVSFPPNVNILPQWYTAFRLYVLAQCNALTTDSVSDALEHSGYIGLPGYNMFFSMLNTFVEACKVGDNLLP